MLTFMQSMDHDVDDRDGGYSLGIPVQELTFTLTKLTGEPQHEDLGRSTLKGNAASCDAKLDVFYASAKRWAAWWDANWRSQTDDEAYSKVNLPERRRYSTPE